jgi:hypothetical protein
MEGERPGWIVLSRELASDLLELADAEIEATRDEISRVWRRAWTVAALVGLAACLAFWLVALFAYTLVAVAQRWLSPWAAGLAVAGAFLVAIVALLAAAWLRARRLESPLDILVRHLREHLDWWRREVALSPPPPLAPTGTEGRGRAP